MQVAVLKAPEAVLCLTVPNSGVFDSETNRGGTLRRTIEDSSRIWLSFRDRTPCLRCGFQKKTGILA